MLLLINRSKRSSFIPANKAELRKAYRDLRRQIPAAYRHKAAHLAAERLVAFDVFQQSARIACYLPCQDEFDTYPVIEKIWASKKICYLPVLAEGNALNFVRYDRDDELEKNSFAIWEPKNQSRKIAVEKIDLVIAPLVAFDHAGNRLGTGGGYYDRTFSHKHADKNKPPYIMGIGYAIQQATALLSDPWDVRLESVLTENNLLLTHGQ